MQAGHASAGFTLDRYGHLLERSVCRPVEWIDDLLGGWNRIEDMLDTNRQLQADEHSSILQEPVLSAVKDAGTNSRDLGLLDHYVSTRERS